MKWAGHVVRVGERRGIYRVLVGKPEGKSYHLGDLDIYGRIILKMELKEVGCGEFLD